MKKLILLLVIVVAAAVGARMFRSSPDQITFSPQPTPSSSYTLAVIASNVSVNDQRIAQTTTVKSGDTIKTDATGRAKLLYPNGTITTIESDTTLVIDALDKNGSQSRIRLVVGGVWSKVKNILGTGEYYEVETENTVASVRGTIFATEFRNKRSRIVGIEGRVRAQARDPIKKALIVGAEADITTGEQTTIESDRLPVERRAIAKAILSDIELRGEIVKEVLQDVTREDVKNLEDQKVRAFIQRVRQANEADRPFIEKLRQERLIEDVKTTPTPTSRVAPTPLRTPTASNPVVTPSLKPSPSPTPRADTTSPTPTQSVGGTVESPSPTPIRPTAKSITPRTAKAGDTIAVNGEGFRIGNTNQVSSGMIGQRAVSVGVVDAQTLFIDIPGDLAVGVYDVSLKTVGGETSLLVQVLTVQ